MEECLLGLSWMEDFLGTFANHGVGVFRGIPGGILQAFLSGQGF